MCVKTILELISKRDRPLRYLLENTRIKTYYELKAELRKMLSNGQIQVYRHENSKLIYVKRAEEETPNVALPREGEGTVFIG